MRKLRPGDVVRARWDGLPYLYTLTKPDPDGWFHARNEFGRSVVLHHRSNFVFVMTPEEAALELIEKGSR